MTLMITQGLFIAGYLNRLRIALWSLVTDTYLLFCLAYLDDIFRYVAGRWWLRRWFRRWAVNAITATPATTITTTIPTTILAKLNRSLKPR
jgi:hypothetical protein